jgi:hypothetical protein
LDFTLRDDPKVAYSDRERKVLLLLPVGEGSARSTTQLAKMLFGKVRPWNSQRMMVGLINSIRKKAEHNGEEFAVRTGGRIGPSPMMVWIEV